MHVCIPATQDPLPSLSIFNQMAHTGGNIITIIFKPGMRLIITYNVTRVSNVIVNHDRKGGLKLQLLFSDMSLRCYRELGGDDAAS